MRPGQKPPTSRAMLNNIALGPDSPLLSQPKEITAREFAVQGGLIELLVGRVGVGDRRMGDGLTGRIPSLYLIYAIPNGASASSKTEAAKRKREGQLRGMPDLHWPVARGPFIGLYLETKRKSEKARARQREMHALLRDEGHAVVVYDSVQAGLNVVLRYHALGLNRPSVRPCMGWTKGTPLVEVVRDWRQQAHADLDALALA